MSKTFNYLFNFDKIKCAPSSDILLSYKLKLPTSGN